MANNFDDAPQAWVWSEYRAEQAGGAPVVNEVLTVVESVDAPLSDISAAPVAGQGGSAAGLILAAFVLTILGLLWFTSGGNKPEATADQSAAPAGSTASPPVAEPASPPAAAVAPADPAPAVAAPPSAPEPEKPAPHRHRRHR